MSKWKWITNGDEDRRYYIVGVWCKRDVEKLNCMRRNKLNYIVKYPDCIVTNLDDNLVNMLLVGEV